MKYPERSQYKYAKSPFQKGERPPDRECRGRRACDLVSWTAEAKQKVGRDSQ